jgi:photosystem II stability/assembly factor-like uncharacterized protein
LREGTIVRSRDVFKRVFVDSHHGVALAGVGQAQYPVATRDAGRTWRTSGPALHLDAAQAPLAVREIGALSRKVYFAAGSGEVVDATPDGGKHWYQTLFGGGVVGVIAANGELLALISGNEPATGTSALYGSTDGGRTWHREQNL